MYNSLFGMNNVAPICTSIAGIDYRNIERFRDAILRKRNNNYYVEILTRTGGPNRGCYENKILIQSNNYIRDFDDKYDNTYRHYIFKIGDIPEFIDLKFLFNNQSRKSLNLKKMFTKECLYIIILLI